MKYVCTLLTSDNPLNFTPSDVQEATVDMVASGRTFLLRIQTDDGKTGYGHSAFCGSQQFATLFSVKKQIFTVRGIYPIGKFSDPPIAFRIYTESDEKFLENCTSSTFLANEDAFFQILQQYIHGRITHESQRQLCLVKDAVEWDSPNKKYAVTVSAKRTLSPEQRLAAQELLNNMSANIIEYGPSLEIDSETFYDFDRNVFDSKEVEHGVKYRLNVGFVSGSAGCGRRRAYASAMSVIASGALPIKGSRNMFSADKVSAIVCKKDSVSKWLEELQDISTYVIENEEDFDQCSYAALEKGGVVIFCTDFSWCAKQEEDACTAMKNVSADMRTPLNVPQLARMHVNLKMKEAVAVLRWVKFRMLLVDDVIDIVSKDTTRDMTDNAFLPIVQNMKAEWTWIHLFTPTPISHIPYDCVDKTDIFMAIPHHIFSRDLEVSQITPRIFSSLDATYVRMKTPGAILRKVTLIPVSVRANEDELDFVDNFRRMQQSLSATPLQSIDISSALLGAPLESVPGTSIYDLLPRLQTMSKENILSSVVKHFQSGDGTVAQRVLSAGARKLNVLFQQTFVNKDFVLTAQSSPIAQCPVCACDDANVLALCGHSFCSSCVLMLRRSESKTAYTPCPTCRSSLSSYDWLQLGDHHTFVSSKMNAIKERIATIFSRRRPKRRGNGMVCLLFCPADTCDLIRALLKKDDENDIDTELGQRNCVRILSFDNAIDLCKKPLTMDVEAVVMASPPALQQTQLYHGIVRAASHRATPLQLHLLFTLDVEEIRYAMRVLLPVSDEPRRNFIRR